ncbi:uncharacterized protein LOC142996300 isoform X2 [Genypterus blacodes]|uniref:uncharacterized protein LOC142996300 isoform X2 n=1 Tax=Genypterus blacodes TaxID=154954 RepID=UPI003F77465D
MKRVGAGEQRAFSPASLKRPRSWAAPGTSAGSPGTSAGIPCGRPGISSSSSKSVSRDGGRGYGAAGGRRSEGAYEGRQRNTKIKLQQILEKQEMEMKTMKQSLAHIQEMAREADDYCESIIAGLIDRLQKHYGSVREMIEAQEQERNAQLQRSIQTLKLKMDDVKNRDAQLDCMDESESSVQQFSSVPSLSEEDTFHLETFLEDSRHPFQSIKRDVELFGKQLEAFSDDKFTQITHMRAERAEEDKLQTSVYTASVSQPGLCAVNSKLTGPPAEPTTRAEFLQYACELSLDPTTAHADLLVSNGDKEVKLCTETWRNPSLRHPQRFIHRRQVLCSEGLRADCCYYELEVKGGKAEIALAYKGMDRRSRTSLSAFGGNQNSWSLDRAKNYSVSHRGDSVQLAATPSCCRIGVYLKFKEGTLAFYEVSNDMKFLYKIRAEFAEPLYPGFWLGEKCSIRLCDLSPARL